MAFCKYLSDQFDNHKNIYPTHPFSAFLENVEGHSSVQCSGTDLRHSSSDTEKKTIEEKEFRTDLSKKKQLKKNYSEQIFLAQMLKKIECTILE